jgi:PAS domain S-box-containing protein
MKVNHSLIALLDNVPDAIIAMTPDGTVLGWNQDAIEMLGYSSDEAQGRSIDDLVVPADRISEEQDDFHRKARAHCQLHRTRARSTRNVLAGFIRTSCARELI